MQNNTKHQILIIGGGEAFDTPEGYLEFLKNSPLELGNKHKSWKGWLLTGLSDNFDGIRVAMPDSQNSYYPAWKIWFEKYFELLGKNKLIIVGHSLGGIFIVKYLTENSFSKNIDSLHLISPVYNNEGLLGESIASFAFNTNTLSSINNNAKDIHLWHSKDDPVVPYEHSMKYHTQLENSILHTFEDRGHFSNQSHFVELFLEIQKQK